MDRYTQTPFRSFLFTRVPITTLLAFSVLLSAVIGNSPIVTAASAATVDRFCTCQGYGGTNGFQIPGQRTYLEDAHWFAVNFCETGTRHPLAREGSGVFCNPAPCPSGTIDLGVVVRDCQGIRKSRESGAMPVPDNFAPSEGGCNYVPAATAAAGTITCDLQCQRVRQCGAAVN